MTTNLITLFRLNGQWLAKHSDKQVKELFGTDILPTPYFDTLPAEVVLREVAARNPSKVVKIGTDTPKGWDRV